MDMDKDNWKEEAKEILFLISEDLYNLDRQGHLIIKELINVIRYLDEYKQDR